VGENHWLKTSEDHISMHFEGTESSGEAGHLENRNTWLLFKTFSILRLLCGQNSNPYISRQPYLKPLKMVKVFRDFLT